MSLPGELTRILPEDTARTWTSIRDVVPTAAYLGGGTAIAIHLQHRVSRDLDSSSANPFISNGSRRSWRPQEGWPCSSSIPSLGGRR